MFHAVQKHNIKQMLMLNCIYTEYAKWQLFQQRVVIKVMY